MMAGVQWNMYILMCLYVCQGKAKETKKDDTKNEWLKKYIKEKFSMKKKQFKQVDKFGCNRIF